MARKKKPAEHANHERWLVSYADFITLLFAFFVVMFAASNADEQKAGQVAESVKEGFSELALFSPSSSIFALFLDDGLLPSNKVTIAAEMGGAFSERNAVSIEQVKSALEDALGAQVREGGVRLTIDERGLTISLAEPFFFAPGLATVQSGALLALAEIASIILDVPYDVRIEGHTDNVPINTAQFRSNWELSTARAVYVLRYLIGEGEVVPSRLSAIGYGEYRPVTTNKTIDGRALNRRVDIVVMNTSMDQLEPKAFAERTLEETGAPTEFLEPQVSAAEQTEALPEGD